MSLRGCHGSLAAWNAPFAEDIERWEDEVPKRHGEEYQRGLFGDL